MPHLLGRKPAVYTAGSVQRSHIMCAALDALGTPPDRPYNYTAAVTKAVNDNWQMLGNDTAGDCTVADCGHQLMIRTANTTGIIVPTTHDIFAMYSDLTGYDPDTGANDNGCDEIEVMQYLENKGLLGHFIQGHANLNVQNLNHLKWAVHIYGASRLGIQLPDSAEDQFDNNQVWDVRAGAKVLGGHDVCVVYYEPDTLGGSYYWIVSWGKMIPVTEAFLKWTLDDGTQVLEEAHAEASDDLLLATGDTPANYNHAQLISDLQAVSV